MATTLTLEQEQEYNRDKKVAQYLAANSAIVSAYPPLAAKATNLNDFISKIALNDTNTFLMIENVGATQGHYKFTFANLQP